MFKQSGNYPGIFVYGKEQFTPLYPKVVSGNTVQSSVLCQCLLPIDNSFQVVPFIGGDPNDQYRNDDGSTQPIQLPFNFCFYGQTMNSLFINNNGNISFIAPYGTFTSNSFPDPTFIMIAPFWGDVDTRNALSGVVYYKVTPTYMVVRWKTVGYFNQYADKTNDFQLIITDGNDPILPAGNNVSFCYGDMQWTTGDASGGTNGFGGNPATVGVNRGNGVDYIQIGRFDQPGNLYDGPFGNPDQVSWLDNQTFYFNVCNNGSGNNLPPIVNSAEVCDTIYACIGDTIFINASFLSPEQSQNTSVTYSTTSTGLNILNNQTGNQALWSAEFIASAANLGVNTIVITGTDNGVPAASTNATVIVEVIPLPQITISYSPSSPQVSPATVQFTSVTPGAVSWLWNFGDGDTSGVQSPQHVFHGDSVFTIVLTATLYTGCSSSDTVTFEVIGGVPVVAPNVVTPNGDGVNDALVFEHLDLYARSRLKVYNRWGNVIYENVDYHNDWKPNVSDGVYYYEITGPFIYEPITGFFHVIRSGK
ncbi:MAG: hypothetical protein Fur0041_19980 [Bacteroidia bacterium]